MTGINYSICKKKAKTNLKNYASMCYLLTNAKTHNWVNFASEFSLKSVKKTISPILKLTVKYILKLRS